MATTSLEWTSTASNSGFTNPDNVAAKDDSRATGAVAGDSMSIELDDAPGDYNDTNSGNTVTLTVQARTQGTVSRDKQVVLTLTDSGGTPITDSVGADITFTTTDLTGSDADYTSSAFTLSDNYTGANVTGWRLQADITESGGMADSATVEIDYMAVGTLQYDAGGTQFNQACDAFVSATASLSKQTATTKAATSSATASITKDTTLSAKAATASATPGLTKQTAPTAFSASVSAVATQDAALIFLQSAPATVSATADLTTSITFAQTAAAVVSATASLTKKTLKALSATVSAVAALATEHTPAGGGGGGPGPYSVKAMIRSLVHRPRINSNQDMIEGDFCGNYEDPES